MSTAEVPESEEDAPAPKKKPVAKSKPKPSKVPESKAAATDKEAGDDGELVIDATCSRISCVNCRSLIFRS